MPRGVGYGRKVPSKRQARRPKPRKGGIAEFFRGLGRKK